MHDCCIKVFRVDLTQHDEVHVFFPYLFFSYAINAKRFGSTFSYKAAIMT